MEREQSLRCYASGKFETYKHEEDKEVIMAIKKQI